MSMIQVTDEQVAQLKGLNSGFTQSLDTGQYVVGFVDLSTGKEWHRGSSPYSFTHAIETAFKTVQVGNKPLTTSELASQAAESNAKAEALADENAKLREQLDRMSGGGAAKKGRPIQQSPEPDGA